MTVRLQLFLGSSSGDFLQDFVAESPGGVTANLQCKTKNG